MMEVEIKIFEMVKKVEISLKIWIIFVSVVNLTL